VLNIDKEKKQNIKANKFALAY